MFGCRQVANYVWIGVLLAGTILCWSAHEVVACLAHYRSPEWQVANSPLIVIGEVEKVENGLLPKQPGRSDFGEDDRKSGKKTTSTIATVRILRVLKGRYPHLRIRVGSGPIPTCGGDVHFSFKPGQQHIFLLPLDPQDGGAALRFGRSVLPLTETAMIESRIARAIAYRAAYLDALQHKNRNVYAAAVQLAKDLRAESKRWPDFVHDKKTGDSGKEFKSGMIALKKRLAAVDVETIVAAQAVDWLNDEPNIWWRRDLWERVIRDLAESRKKEAAAVQEVWIRRTLADAGVEQAQIDAYLKAARRDNCHASIKFPIEPPFLWNSLSTERDGALLTTDFILHYYAYDRGGMLVEYSPNFSAAVLADLDMRRVKPLVASLYRSDSERLRWLAQQAIAYVPGTDCVDIVLEDLVKERRDYAWRVLEYWQCPKETAARLEALIDLGAKEYTVWGQEAMWQALKQGKCFEPICIQKALTALERLETKKAVRKAENNGAGPGQENESVLAVAIREYLAAAKAHRKGTSPTVITAADYRQWFRTYPAKNKEGDK